MMRLNRAFYSLTAIKDDRDLNGTTSHNVMNMTISQFLLQNADWSHLEQDLIMKKEDLGAFLKIKNMDSGSTLRIIRKITEGIVRYLCNVHKDSNPPKFAELVKQLKEQKMVPLEISSFLYDIKNMGNQAAHPGEIIKEASDAIIPIFETVLKWVFMHRLQTYCPDSIKDQEISSGSMPRSNNDEILAILNSHCSDLKGEIQKCTKEKNQILGEKSNFQKMFDEEMGKLQKHNRLIKKAYDDWQKVMKELEKAKNNFNERNEAIKNSFRPGGRVWRLPDRVRHQMDWMKQIEILTPKEELLKKEYNRIKNIQPIDKVKMEGLQIELKQIEGEKLPPLIKKIQDLEYRLKKTQKEITETQEIIQNKK